MSAFLPAAYMARPSRRYASRFVAPIVLMTIGICQTGHAQAKHLVGLADMQRGSAFVQSMQLSPDGHLLAATVSWEHPDLWLVSTRPGSVPRHLGAGQFPHWSPDGKRLAFYSRESGTLQLWVFNRRANHVDQVTYLPNGIDPNPLTENIGFEGWAGDPLRYAWSPDGTRLVFASQVASPATNRIHVSRQSANSSAATDARADATPRPLVLTTSTPPGWTLAGIFRSGGFGAAQHVADSPDHSDTSPPRVTTSHLFIVDVRTKVVRQLTHDTGGYFTPDWSPDGRRIVCVSFEGRPLLGWGSGPTNLYAVDVATGDATALTADEVYKRVPLWSPDGKWISYYGARKANLGLESILVTPSGGGPGTSITAQLDRGVGPGEEAHWLADSRSMAVLFSDGLNVSIARLRVPSGEVEILDGLASAWRQSLTVSRSGDLAWVQSDGTNPALVQVLAAGNTAAHVLVNLDPEVDNLQLGVQEVIGWKTDRGYDLAGVLIKPVGYRYGHRYPLIVDVYPMLKNEFKAGWAMVPGQGWAARGYAVFYPGPEAPHVWQNPWKSVTHNTRAKGPDGIAVAVEDVMSGVDELIRQGIVDPDRMCLYGFSNGGAMVNQLVTRTTRFKCAVSVAAALSVDWGTAFFLRTQAQFVPDVAGVTPWQNPNAYVALSAVYHLDKVNTPMLLADGDNDGFFLLGSIEMYNGLRYLGKDVTFVRYPGQEHGFEGAAMKDFWERENAFFDSYLHPEPPEP